MTQNTNKLTAWLAAGAFASAWLAPAILIDSPSNGLTETQVEALLDEKLSPLNEKLDTLNVDVTITEGNKTDAIYAKIFEDDAWEAEAEVIAMEEWEDNDYKDIFNAIFKRDNVTLADKEDITYVREDESTKFIEMKAKDKDGTIIQYLRVKYEDVYSKNQRIYVTVETKFDDGDIEYQHFNITSGL